jgi:hypothetical protein
MISKSLSRVTGFVVAAMAAALLLLTGTGTAAATTTAPGDGGGGAGQGGAAVAPSDETHALVVGGIAFVLIIGVAGAVLWNTARKRHTPS